MEQILIIRQPKTKKEIDLMYDLRWRILRKPWNQPKGSEKDDKESIAIHLIALINNKIIGTVRYHKINEKVGQIRYLAVDENYQKKGVGRNLMEAVQLIAQNLSTKYLILNSRESAFKFFEKLGYKLMGEGPLLFGEIKHFKMMKKFKESELRYKK